MKIVAYLAACSEQIAIRDLADSLPDYQGVTRELHRSRSGTGSHLWIWRTPRQEIDGGELEQSVEKFLNGTIRIRKAILTNRASLQDVYLGIVMRYDKGESPRGLAVSPAAIAMLSELDAAIEVDAVTLLDDDLA